MTDTVEGARAEFERRPPLVMIISDWLVQQIISGRYEPGQWLREQDIADACDASRGPVREALRLVAMEGLVELIPWRGAQVVEPNIEEIDDMFEVASALTGLVARLAAVHASTEDIGKVADLVARMKATLDSGGSMREQLALSFETSAALRQICGNAQAGSMLMRIGRLAYWHHRHLLDANLSWRKEAVLLWERLVEALLQSDATKAERLCRQAVARSKDYVMRRLRRDPRLAKRSMAGALADLPPRLIRALPGEEGVRAQGALSAF